MSSRNCPNCDRVCIGADDCIGERCGIDPCAYCAGDIRTLAEHQQLSMQDYYMHFATGPDDMARILHLLDDESGEPKVFPDRGMVWLRIDKAHKLYVKMDPKMAAEMGAQMLMAAGLALAQPNKHTKEKPDAPQNQTPV